jgi:hypothetical protein
MTYDIGNPGLGLGQAQKCGRVKLVNGIPTLPSCLLDLRVKIKGKMYKSWIVIHFVYMIVLYFQDL